MSHFSPVPPEERTYARNYRKELEPYEAQLVEVSGRCKEFRDHPERRDLQSLLLVNVQIRPVGIRKVIKLSHLWVLTKHIRRAGVEPKRGRRLKFMGSVYAYLRLGGKSKQRGLHGSHDFSILPMEAVAIESFQPGVNQRYEIEDSTSDGGAESRSQTADDGVGQRKTGRSKDSNRRRGNNRSSNEGPEHGSGVGLDDRPQGKRSSRRSRKSETTDSARGAKGARNRRSSRKG